MIIKFLIRDLLNRLAEPLSAKLVKEDKSGYNTRCKELSRDEVLADVMNTLANSVKIKLQHTVRDDKTSRELYGMLAYHEMLRRKLTTPVPVILKRNL